MGAIPEAATRGAAIREADIREEEAVTPDSRKTAPTVRRSSSKSPSRSGGRYFEAKKKDSVDDIYAQIAEELRTQFMLGYTPPKDQSSGYHSIHLTPKKKDLTVQTRAGYYSGQ